MLKITHQDLLKLKPVEARCKVLEVYLKNGGSISKTSRETGGIKGNREEYSEKIPGEGRGGFEGKKAIEKSSKM